MPLSETSVPVDQDEVICLTQKHIIVIIKDNIFIINVTFIVVLAVIIVTVFCTKTIMLLIHIVKQPLLYLITPACPVMVVVDTVVCVTNDWEGESTCFQ